MRRTNLPTHESFRIPKGEKESEKTIKVGLIAMKNGNEHRIPVSFRTGYSISIVAFGIVVAVEAWRRRSEVASSPRDVFGFHIDPQTKSVWTPSERPSVEDQKRRRVRSLSLISVNELSEVLVPHARLSDSCDV